ncbi:MAG: ATP-binding protein [Dehalococcoidia bacterium]
MGKGGIPVAALSGAIDRAASLHPDKEREFLERFATVKHRTTRTPRVLFHRGAFWFGPATGAHLSTPIKLGFNTLRLSALQAKSLLQFTIASAPLAGPDPDQVEPRAYGPTPRSDARRFGLSVEGLQPASYVPEAGATPRLIVRYDESISIRLVEHSVHEREPLYPEMAALEPDENCMPTKSVVTVTGQHVQGVKRPVVLFSDIAEEDKMADLRDSLLPLVCHEIRTPLMHIKGFAESLLQTDVRWDEGTQLDFLRAIDKEADRLNNLIEHLLAISRANLGEPHLNRDVMSPYDLILKGIYEARPFLSKHKVTVRVRDSLPYVYVDVDRIMQVLVNLFENAAKYSPSFTKITVDAEGQGGFVLLSITDEGKGVSAKDRTKIFDLFFRSAPDTVSHPPQRVSGNGLGLAVAKAEVEAHGGRIWVESRGGKGSTFYFSLPVAQDLDNNS